MTTAKKVLLILAALSFFFAPCPTLQGAEIYTLLATRGVPSLGIYNIQFNPTFVNKDDHLTSGYNLLTDFKFQEAIPELQAAISHNPSNRFLQSEAYSYIGYCYLNMRNPQLTKQNLEKAIMLNPRNELPHFFMANEYFLDGDMEKVIINLKEAIDIHPKFIAALRMLAETYKDQGEGSLAIMYYKKLADLLPNSGYYRFQLYRAYSSQGMYKDAEDQAKMLMKIEPGFNLNFTRLGEVYQKQKRYDKALSTYNELIKRDRDSYLGYLGRAQVYFSMGKYRETRREIVMADKLSPNNKEVRDVLFELDRIEHENRKRIIYTSMLSCLIFVLFGLLLYYVYSTHRRNYVLSIISRFNEQIDQIYDINELALFLLEFFAKILNMDYGFILLYNRQNNKLALLSSKTPDESEYEAFQIVTGNEVTNWIVRESRPLISTKDLERSRYFEEAFPSLLNRLKEKKMKLLIPLKEKNSCIGFIALGDTRSQEVSKQKQDDLFTPLNAIAAQAMQTLFLFESSIVDELTTLYNKRYFYQTLGLELKRADRYKQPCSLCTFDIDDFKKLNDTFGHSQGDQVLKELGGIVRNSIREGIDVACRTGGEEFHLILPATTQDLSVTVAQRIRSAVEDNNFSGFDKPRKITVSIGIATYPDHAQDEAELIKISDKALYLAKRSGKNTVKKADELELEKGRQKKSFKSDTILDSRFDHLNIKDELTGLSSFSYFSMRIKEEIKRTERYKFPCSLLIMKLDNKVDEKNLDSLLQQISIIVKSNLREGIDTPARIVEDTIAIIAPETPPENALIVARRLQQLIEKKDMKAQDRTLTISMGISAFPDCAATADELMESATIAVKKAQRAGGNKIVTAPAAQPDNETAQQKKAPPSSPASTQDSAEPAGSPPLQGPSQPSA